MQRVDEVNEKREKKRNIFAAEKWLILPYLYNPPPRVIITLTFTPTLIKHFVCLIKNQHLNAARAQVAPTDHIEHAARRTRHDVLRNLDGEENEERENTKGETKKQAMRVLHKEINIVTCAIYIIQDISLQLPAHTPACGCPRQCSAHRCWRDTAHSCSRPEPKRP